MFIHVIDDNVGLFFCLQSRRIKVTHQHDFSTDIVQVPTPSPRTNMLIHNSGINLYEY